MLPSRLNDLFSLKFQLRIVQLLKFLRVEKYKAVQIVPNVSYRISPEPLGTFCGLSGSCFGWFGAVLRRLGHGRARYSRGGGASGPGKKVKNGNTFHAGLRLFWGGSMQTGALNDHK